jgi:hypothetical protein
VDLAEVKPLAEKKRRPKRKRKEEEKRRVMTVVSLRPLL